MKRLDLVGYRRTLVTPDTAEAVRQLELRAVAHGDVRVIVQGPSADKCSWVGVKNDPGPTGCPAYMSMRPTGRELYLRVQLVNGKGSPEEQRQQEVSILWGLAVPCGFTPWLRYPLAGRGDDVFHFLGPWQPLYDSLLGEGRGEEAWPSLCAAAQVDVGRWEGGRELERFVQAQLHRMGVPCGCVDGVVGARTTEGLRGLGYGGIPFTDVAQRLCSIEPIKQIPEKRRGFISIEGSCTAASTGKVALLRNPQGYAVAISGPGRVILDVS
jgi:hypothetical protein